MLKLYNEEDRSAIDLRKKVKRGKNKVREKNRKPIASYCRFPQFTTMNVIDGQAVINRNFSLIFYSLTIDNILNIIVLLILAGVTISMALGSNGIIEKAETASNMYANATKDEKTLLDELDSEVVRLSGSISNSDIKCVDRKLILMENGKLYRINDLTDTHGMNLQFNNENINLSLYAENVKELFQYDYFLTFDNKLYSSDHVITPELIGENVQKIVDYDSDSDGIYYIDNNNTFYFFWRSLGELFLIADDVEFACSYVYETKDGDLYEFYEENESINRTEITDEEEKNEIKGWIENNGMEYYYDANNDECAAQYRTLSTSFETTEYSCEISFIKEDGEWYYNTSIHNGGVS